MTLRKEQSVLSPAQPVAEMTACGAVAQHAAYQLTRKTTCQIFAAHVQLRRLQPVTSLLA